MTIDITKEYDTSTKQLLKGLWTDIVKDLAKKHDHKKIISFLNKCAIIDINEDEKQIVVGIPNEFVMSQVKKFFGREIEESIHKLYNSWFSSKCVVFSALQKAGHELHIDCKKIVKPEETAAQKQSIEKHFNKEFSNYFGILFDSQYTFNAFVSGAHNELVASAARAVSDAPGMMYNPLFIYGNVWLGKTHIMQAIGNHIIQNQPQKTVVYLPTSKLIDEIVLGIRKNKLGALMSKLDQVDVLLLDDIQFIADKEKTQEIFHNIFNDFHMKKKQIVITCDRPPKELNNIAERLKSRFSLGLVADIQAPDFETRVAILATKAEQKEVFFPSHFLEIIAKHINTNVRELEWALNLVITKQKLTQRDLTEEDIHSCLQTLGYKTLEPTAPELDTTHGKQVYFTKTLNFGDIVNRVANYYQICPNEIKGESRKKEISIARQLLMMIAKKEFNRTLERIGDYFGWKNHATVIYSIRKIEKKIKSDQFLSRDYHRIMETE